MHVPVCGFVHMSAGACRGQTHQILWSWSYSCFWTTWHACCGPVSDILQERCMFLIAKPSSKLLILIFNMYLWWAWPKTVLSLNSALMTISLKHELLLSLFYNNNKKQLNYLPLIYYFDYIQNIKQNNVLYIEESMLVGNKGSCLLLQIYSEWTDGLV